MKNAGTLKVTTPSDREIALTRVFDAPRDLVFDAVTKPELVRRWLLGPPGWSMVACEIDLKVGGHYRYVWLGPDGAQMGMHGTFRAIDPPQRIASTGIFDFGCDAQSGESLGTTVLTERDGKTTLTTTILYPSKEARDEVIASGMERGVTASYDRLGELLRSPRGGLQARSHCSGMKSPTDEVRAVVLENPHITETAAQMTAIIHLIVPREQIQTAMGPGLGELMTTLAAQGIAPAGPWFAHHLKMDPKAFDFEIGVPVTAPVAAAGRVKPGQLPATKLARTMYHGPYEGLAAAWREFDAWIAAKGYTPGPDLWECYVAGPESSSNPAAWRTELNRPLIGL